MKTEPIYLSKSEKEKLMQINDLIRECRHLLVESAQYPDAVAFLSDVRDILKQHRVKPSQAS
ncbi:hypothetical protein Pse7367_1756 [Thalassoporum mexicanum PCC 7367]|uniref:hypothetical protein n=1 Tax=Thalassoporum mexicanum TaxID=3457544 RepID=UPI00029FECF9|nr:hypothetical protein [Pseudanabaena sp. PCC 7367]AFY70035.1 hypothetical protein Pse7367_1756 [Pseudanabaena sp. PCC 7367]